MYMTFSSLFFLTCTNYDAASESVNQTFAIENGAANDRICRQYSQSMGDLFKTLETKVKV